MDPAEKFLSKEDRRTIESRIEHAEQRSSGEIVVMAVASSYHYPLAALLGALLFSFIIAIAVTLAFGDEHMWFFLAAFGLTFIALHELTSRVSLLKRLFVKASDMKEEVDEAALSAFYRRNITNTRQHTGVLIYISLFERQVRVVADKGVNSHVDSAVWQEVVDAVIAGIKSGRQTEAIASAVDRCGDILAAHFPPIPGHRNELSNAVIIGT